MEYMNDATMEEIPSNPETQRLYVLTDQDGYVRWLGTTAEPGTALVELSEDIGLDDFVHQEAWMVRDGQLQLDEARLEDITRQEAETEALGARALERMALRDNLLMASMASNMTDEEAYRFENAWPVWTVGDTYLHGQIMVHDGVLYKAQQNVDARAEHPPGSVGTEALYALVQRPVEPGGVLPWVYGEEVHTGDRRAFDGKVYERISPWSAGTNIWEPPTAPGVWREVASE